jgi:peptidoglycan/xylan/chitin deacetylase (PgdA/CDA1 family)
MQYLSENHYVMSLPDMIDALKNGKRIPDKAVAITFDDGYANILENADPILKAFNFPYTIFINPEQIGTRNNQLSWEQVKHMAQTGVSFANHTLSHHHMLKREGDESEQQWLSRNTENVMNAEQRIEKELGYSLKLLAYPYGEFNSRLKQHLTTLGYIGFGQQSGAIASFSDFGALPRFPAAGIYANLEPLKTKLNSLALKLVPHSSPQFELAFNHTAPTLTFEQTSEDINNSQLQCFFNNHVLKPRWQDNQMLIELDKELKPGRHRINCTAPSKSNRGRYYWFSHPWFIPTESGSWLD